MLKHGEPARYTVAVTTANDMSIRIIRSTSASIEIPEIGVHISPGSQCQGFVSNVEGVLDRIEQVVMGAFQWGTDEEKENATKLLADIARIKCGTFPVTLILEDPSGNSAIVSDKAEKCVYTPEE